MVSKTNALRKLTNAEPLAEHQADFNLQVSPQQSDRGACLLIASQMDVELDKAIERKLGRLVPDLREELYRDDGPMATFARKITMAAALGVVGPISRENLRIIRHVRNAFAHAKRPITFATPEVSAMCLDLRSVSLTHPSEPSLFPDTSNPRKVFETVCAATMMRLATYAGLKFTINADGIEQPILGGPLP